MPETGPEPGPESGPGLEPNPEPLTILITRPEPGGSATAQAIRALGHIPILAPCLAIEPLPATLPTHFDAIVIASAQALPGLPASLHAAPLFAVGDATAARARAQGFSAVTSAAGTATELAHLITRTMPPRARLLLPCGAGHSLDLAAALRAANFQVTRRIVYRSSPAETLPAAALEALQAEAIDRVLIFSPATARHFTTLIHRSALADTLRRVIAIAISQAAAAPLTKLPFQSIRVAVSPDQHHMLVKLP